MKNAFDKRMIQTCIFILCLFVLNAKIVNAASWFVDKDAVGASNGTAWASAWTSLSSISGASSGDTIYISGGTTSKIYTGQLNIAAGITVKPGAAEPFPIPNHSGLVVLTNPGASYCVTFTGNNGTIDGLVSGTRKIKISNVADYGIYGDSRTGVLVRGIEITNVGKSNGGGTSRYGWGVFFLNSEGEIGNLHIHALNDAIDAAVYLGFSADSNRYDRWLLHHSIIEVPIQATGGLGADGIQTTNSLTAYNNTISTVVGYTGNQHSDGMQSMGQGYYKIYNNVMTGFPNYTLYMSAPREHVQIYNNYFYKTRAPVVFGNWDLPNGITDVHVYNNTLVDCTGAPNPAISYDFATRTPTFISDVAIKNNLLVNCGSGIQVMTTAGTRGSWQCGTDILVDKNVSPSVSCKGSGYTQPTYGSNATPSFVSYTPMVGVSNNMRLKSSDTVANNKGLNISPLFVTDKEGIPRAPLGSAWDIGAYEGEFGGGYDDSGKVPMIPLSINIQ